MPTLLRQNAIFRSPASAILADAWIFDQWPRMPLRGYGAKHAQPCHSYVDVLVESLLRAPSDLHRQQK
jgi:hypothetical protein